jgi:hypothetical protein
MRLLCLICWHLEHRSLRACSRSFKGEDEGASSRINADARQADRYREWSQQSSVPSDLSREQIEKVRLQLEGVRKRTKPRTLHLHEVFHVVLYLFGKRLGSQPGSRNLDPILASTLGPANGSNPGTTHPNCGARSCWNRARSHLAPEGPRAWTVLLCHNELPKLHAGLGPDLVTAGARSTPSWPGPENGGHYSKGKYFGRSRHI